MSRLSISGKSNNPMKDLVDQLALHITERGTEFASSRHTDAILGMESLPVSELQDLNTSAQGMGDTIRSTYESYQESDIRLGSESLSNTQVEAGTMAAMAAGNPMKYAQEAMSRRPTGGNGINVVSYESAGIAGRLDYRDEYSAEAFDEVQLKNMIPYSIAFNVQASRQDDFSETFYPTTVVSPDNGGIDIMVDRVSVHNGAKHVDGKTTDFNQRNLLEAVTDASILADESTALVPFMDEAGENDEYFLEDTVVAPHFREVGGVDVRTAPLKIDKKMNLLGLSSHPKLIGAGVMDHTDAIDARMYLDKLYLKNGGTGAVFRFNVNRLPRNTFHKSIEGSDREMTLNFRSDALVLNNDTTAVDGSVPATVQAIKDANYTVRLNLKVSGDANVEFGTLQLNATPVEITEITDEDHNQISLTAGQGKAIVDSFADLRVIGYELNASRTNSNRRTRGLLINTVAEVERFNIPLGAPISAPSPIGSDRDARDLDSLITAARIRNSNNAVTTLLNYADTLRAFVQNRRMGQGIPTIEGVGRHMIVPFYEEMDLDLNTTINSLKSKDRAEDISAVLINAIRDIAYRMYRNSGYQAALDASNVGSKKPTLLVGTDTVIQRHLMVPGDNRTFGIGFEDAKVVTSFDTRMDGKIVLTFRREGGDGRPDPLSFGTHAWIPELTSSIMVQRDGATYQEAMVQPRNRHINNLPIMAIINVTGLEDVLTSKVSVDTNDVTEGGGGGTTGGTTDGTTAP